MAEKTLTARQREAIRRIVHDLPPFLTETATAKNCGISRTTLQKWRRDPLFTEALETEYKVLWKASANDAMRKMIELAMQGDRQAAAYILDSCGYGAPQKVEVTGADIEITIK